MAESTKLPPTDYVIRAALPRYFRFAAVVVVVASVLVVVASFYNATSKSPFRLKSEHARLSTDVISEISGYERLESEDGVSKYFIKAGTARTFSDNHQELRDVYLEVYDKQGAFAQKLAADQVLYIPEENKEFIAYLTGDVRMETSEALKVKTSHIMYDNKRQLAEADEPVEFERETVRGKSAAAVVKMSEKRIDLVGDVDIETFESPELLKSGVRYARARSRLATYDQIANRIELTDNVAITIASRSAEGAPRSTEIQSGRATLKLEGQDVKTLQTRSFELFDNVAIASVENGSGNTNISAGYALFDKAGDRFDLKNAVHIVTSSAGKTTDLRASEAVFEQRARRVALVGNAEATQDGQYLKGDVVTANLFPNNGLKDAVARGNALARQTATEQTTTITAPELNADFDEARHIRTANAVGQSSVEIVPRSNPDYTDVNIAAARGIGSVFKNGLLENLRTDGRTTINLTAPKSGTDTANKRLSADVVKTIFSPNGRDIAKAEASGNAELNVEPLKAGRSVYRTQINAPRFDCEFFPTGNNAKVCVAGKKAVAVRTPTTSEATHGPQKLAADQMTANFSQRSNDVERLEASGAAKFTEGDRNAIAREISFTQADETVRMRGGEPTVWDSRARARAGEIDWDLKNQKSYLREKVSTTYYSRKSAKDSLPFGGTDDPIFVTSNSAEFNHVAETALYSGNARSWQGSNYVRAERLIVDQIGGRMTGDGGVESLLYNAKLKQKGGETLTTVYARAKTFGYDKNTRILQYRNAVDIRQGTDRLTTEAADVHLSENNEVSRTTAEGSVIITQPGRRATGDWAEYSTTDEVAIIRGSPASVTDSQNGSSQSSQLTFYMRDNRVVAETKTKTGTPGRSRTVYKVKPNN